MKKHQRSVLPQQTAHPNAQCPNCSYRFFIPWLNAAQGTQAQGKKKAKQAGWQKILGYLVISILVISLLVAGALTADLYRQWQSLPRTHQRRF
jgi:hypothetical protein